MPALIIAILMTLTSAWAQEPSLDILVRQVVGRSRGLQFAMRRQGARCLGAQANPGQEQNWVVIDSVNCTRLATFIANRSAALGREVLAHNRLAFGPGTPEAMMILNRHYFRVRLMTARSCNSAGTSCETPSISRGTEVSRELRRLLFRSLGGLPRPVGID